MKLKKILKIETLKKGYVDRDKLLLHVCFQILVDFVEKELSNIPKVLIDLDDEESIFMDLDEKIMVEIKHLYKWWKEKRPNRIDPLNKLKNTEIPELEWEELPNKKGFILLDHDHEKYKKYDEAIKEYFILEDKWRKEDKKNLHRLINIRESLWT